MKNDMNRSSQNKASADVLPSTDRSIMMDQSYHPVRGRAERRACWTLAAAAVLAPAVLAAQQPPAQQQRPAMPRITVLGTGPSNSLTDVPGLKVGHFTRSDSGYRSGTTVIRTEQGATAGYSQMVARPGPRKPISSNPVVRYAVCRPSYSVVAARTVSMPPAA